MKDKTRSAMARRLRKEFPDKPLDWISQQTGLSRNGVNWALKSTNKRGGRRSSALTVRALERELWTLDYLLKHGRRTTSELAEDAGWKAEAASAKLCAIAASRRMGSVLCRLEARGLVERQGTPRRIIWEGLDVGAARKKLIEDIEEDRKKVRHG